MIVVMEIANTYFGGDDSALINDEFNEFVNEEEGDWIRSKSKSKLGLWVRILKSFLKSTKEFAARFNLVKKKRSLEVASTSEKSTGIKKESMKCGQKVSYNML